MDKIENREGEPTEEEPSQVEDQNAREEMATISNDIEAGNLLTPELLGRFQELGGKLADKETDGQMARFLLDYDSAELKFKANFIPEAIEDLQELADCAYQRGEAYDQIVEMADERRAKYEAELAKQPKP